MKDKQLFKSISLLIFSVTCCCLIAFLLFGKKMAVCYTFMMALVLIPIIRNHVRTMKSDDETRKTKETKSLPILGIVMAVILIIAVILKML